MNYLQYTSKEMFSSTELIRKSKMVFEKLNKNEIEKAVILRDGKPSFMLLDFDTYETLMQEYIKLKDKKDICDVKNKHKKEEPKEQAKVHKVVQSDKNSIEEIDEEELKKAFEEIESINFEENNSALDEDNFEEVYIEERPIDKNDESLKDFWD